MSVKANGVNNNQRLCHLKTWKEGMVFGFHLVTREDTSEHFVACVRPGLPAFYSGVKNGDKILEVDGEVVTGKAHSEVVRKITEIHEDGVKMLVSDVDFPDCKDIARTISCQTYPLGQRDDNSSIFSGRRKPGCGLTILYSLFIRLMD